MAYYMDSQALIDAVKRRANIPDSQSMITDDEILLYANEELLSDIMPLVMAKHEDYFLIREDVDIVSGQNRYGIPYRAIGNKLREVAYVREDESLIELARVPIDEITSSFTRYAGGHSARRFYIEGEEVVIDVRDSDINYDTLAFFYNIRPNMMVQSSRVSTITGIDATSGIITVDSVPSNFAVGSEVDFIKTKSPHRIISYDITVQDLNTSASYFQFNAADVHEKLSVGDRICLANETDIVNIPSALHVMLAQKVAAKVLESIGDVANMQLAEKKADKMEIKSQALIDNRVTGSPIKAKPRNGLLRGRRIGRYRN